MNYRNHILFALLVVIGLIFLGRHKEETAPLPPEHFATQPAPTSANASTFIRVAPNPENHAGAVAATTNIPPANPASQPRSPGPVVMPRSVATDLVANTNASPESINGATLPHAPPATPVIPLPVELGRTDAPVATPGRDRPYSGP